MGERGKHTTSQKVQRNNIIRIGPNQRTIPNIHTNQFTPITCIRIVDNLNPLANL